MKEVRKSELLKSLRTKSKVGQEFIEEALKKAGKKDVFISGLFFRKEDLDKCKEMLQKAKNAENIHDLKRFLKEDTIPMGLLYKEKFWKEFQAAIDTLYDR